MKRPPPPTIYPMISSLCVLLISLLFSTSEVFCTAAERHPQASPRQTAEPATVALRVSNPYKVPRHYLKPSITSISGPDQIDAERDDPTCWDESCGYCPWLNYSYCYNYNAVHPESPLLKNERETCTQDQYAVCCMWDFGMLLPINVMICWSSCLINMVAHRCCRYKKKRLIIFGKG